MKNLKLIAAFAVAAIMIVSVVAIAYSAPESEASDPVQSDFNIEALMALPDYLDHQHTPESVSMDSSDSPGLNEIIFLKDNYTVLAEQTITIGGTSAIAFCPLQPFSMASTDATFVFLVVSVVFLRLVDEFTIDRVFFLVLDGNGDGLVALVAGNYADTFFS